MTHDPYVGAPFPDPSWGNSAGGERADCTSRGFRLEFGRRGKGAIVLVYEEFLNRDPRWALSEGSRHFEENSAVFKALHGIAQRLNDLGVPYAVVGGMALFRHGLRRFTEDVGILVTKEDLKKIHENLDGLGY